MKQISGSRHKFKQAAGALLSAAALSLIGVAAMLLAVPATAQVSTGDVLGRVTDSSGAVIPGAVVQLVNTGTRDTRTFTTKGAGEYTFSALQPGVYSLSIKLQGFKSFMASSIAVAGGDRVRLDESLVPGAVTEEVVVTATTTALQTDSTSVGNEIGARAITEVPLNGRNFLALVQVQPGVNQGNPTSLAGGSRVSDRRQTSSISANGQNELFNNQMIDGVDNNDRYIGLVELRPSVEAIEQVRTDINLYPAEEGRSVGAVINVITKSGTNQFHGSLYEFFRNDITDTRNYFATASVLAHKPELRQNQYGGSLGGPIFHNKTFFFIDYEGLRRIDGTQSVYTSSVPTAFEHNNPGNLTDIGGTVIPAASLDPTALGYFSLYPLPNLPGNTNNFLYNPAAVQYQSLGDGRIDHHFNASNTLFGRYSYNTTTTYTPPFFPAVNGVIASGVTGNPAPGNSNTTTHNGVFGYTHIFTPSLVMELKASYTYLDFVGTPLNFGHNLNDQAPFKIPNANECLYCAGLATVSITGYQPLGDPFAQPSLSSESEHQYLGNVIYTVGHHNLKAGGSLITRNVSIIQQVTGKGSINFQGATPLAAITNFFKGAPYIYNRQLQLVKPYLRSYEPSVYVQDDWSASAKLKLNLGIRYDIFTAPNEKYGNNASLNLSTFQIDVSQTAGIKTDHHDFSPRLGFDYNLAPGAVLRGGFGLAFFPSDTYQAFYYNDPPYAYASGNVQVATQLSTTGEAPAVSQSIAPATVSGLLYSKPQNFRHQYAEQYNVLFQRDFGAGTIFTLGYVGEAGRHLFTQIANVELPAPNGPVAAGTAAPPLIYLAQLPKVTAIDEIGDFGVSKYNSMQVALQRRTEKGLTVNVNYTWARGLDDVYNTADGDAAYGLEPQHINTYDYGNSPIDVQNRFAGTFNYTLPFGKTGTAFYKGLVGGIQINGLGFWQSGLPVSISSSVTQNARATINLPGITVDRPDRIVPVHSGGPVTQYFNVNAFAKQALGTAGNAGRNQVRGPHLRRGDLSLLKTFPIHDRYTGEFRVECFNISNTPNFAQPNGVISAYSATADAQGRFEATNFNAAGVQTGSFGAITATAAGLNGRQFQFAMRLKF